MPDILPGGGVGAKREARRVSQFALSLGTDPSTGPGAPDRRGGAVNPSLGATDAIHGVGPPLRPVPGAPHHFQLRLPW
ncbi:hypothetical protein BEI_2290 [Halomonas beimenensis]|uniref:Uncharacterized protein n=1 Tax=Halomonas beimenensis TaxID=475662 RepID=A0A291P8T4_9GAMM|nr:hypothetical protein BEI_2290 [Halomonas beimenensis]